MNKFVIYALLSFFMINISLLGSSSDCTFKGPLCTTNETNELKPGLYYITYQKSNLFITKKVKIE